MSTEDEDMGEELANVLAEEERARLIAAPVRHSNLKRLSLSPAHYLDGLLRQSAKKRTLDVGSVAHSLVLGGGTDFVVYPGKVRRGKQWDAFAAEHNGKTILIRSEYDTARACADAVLARPDAMKLLEGVREQQLKPWRYGDRVCSGRPDVVHPRRIVELKTSASVEPFRFTRQGVRMFYHSQLDWYLEGNRATGGTAEEAWIVAVETTPPFVVQIFQVTPRALEAGRKCWVSWIEQLIACEEADDWPPYQLAPAPFDVDDFDESELVYGDEEAAA